MNPQQLLLFIGILFFGSLGLLHLVQAQRKKQRTRYISGILGVSMVFVAVLALLNQKLLALVLMVAIGVLSAAALPTLMKAQRLEVSKELKEVDLSAPLRIRDFLTYEGLLKLAHRWSVWKTVGIYSLFTMTGIAGGLYILSMYGIVKTEFVVVYTILPTITFFVTWYYILSKALRIINSK